MEIKAFTYCYDCGKVYSGVYKFCENCKSKKVYIADAKWKIPYWIEMEKECINIKIEDN